MTASQNTVCPDHGIDVKKKGYDLEEGWKRCPVSEDIPKTGICLFTRQVSG